MTILMTRILLSPRFTAGSRQRLAANLAVIAASNVGANYTLIGSLAAVMWLKLLKVGGCAVYTPSAEHIVEIPALPVEPKNHDIGGSFPGSMQASCWSCCTDLCAAGRRNSRCG